MIRHGPVAARSRVVGGVELGGTKTICAFGSGPRDIRAIVRLATRGPVETLCDVIAFFQSAADPIESVGIGSFGPIELDPRSPRFGTILATPKLDWRGINVAEAIQRGLNVSVAIDTDVTAAALAEYQWGGHHRSKVLVYMTVGTGIGGAVLLDGRPSVGPRHPEMGHISVPRVPTDDMFVGVCPYHADCLEGLASGPAIAARWGAPPETLALDHPAWVMEAQYLGVGLATLTYVLAPDQILLGGGVMGGPRLLPSVGGGVPRRPSRLRRARAEWRIAIGVHRSAIAWQRRRSAWSDGPGFEPEPARFASSAAVPLTLRVQVQSRADRPAGRVGSCPKQDDTEATGRVGSP